MNSSPDTNENADETASDSGWQHDPERGLYFRNMNDFGFRVRLEAVPLRKGLKAGPTATIDFAKALTPRVGLGLNSAPERLASILDNVATAFPEIARLIEHCSVRPALARTSFVDFHLTHDTVRVSDPLKFHHQFQQPSGEPTIAIVVVTSIHIDEQDARDDCAQEGREFVGTADITLFAPDVIRTGWGTGRPWTVETINGTGGFFTASTVISTTDFDVVLHARSIDKDFYDRTSATYASFPAELTHPAMSEAIMLMDSLRWPSRAKDPKNFHHYSKALTEQGRAFKQILAATFEQSREADAVMGGWGGTALVRKSGEPMLKSCATLVQVDLGAAGVYDQEHETDEGRFRFMRDSLRVGWLTLVEFLPAGTASVTEGTPEDKKMTTPVRYMDSWEDYEEIAVICECSWRGTLSECQWDSESEAVGKLECPSCGATQAVLNTIGFTETVKEIAVAGGIKAQKHFADKVAPVPLPAPRLSDSEVQALAVADTAEWMFVPREQWATHPMLAHVFGRLEDWSMFDKIVEAFEVDLDGPGTEGLRDFVTTIGFAYLDSDRNRWTLTAGNISRWTSGDRAIWYSEDPNRRGNARTPSIPVAFVIPSLGASG